MVAATAIRALALVSLLVNPGAGQLQNLDEIYSVRVKKAAGSQAGGTKLPTRPASTSPS